MKFLNIARKKIHKFYNLTFKDKLLFSLCFFTFPIFLTLFRLYGFKKSKILLDEFLTQKAYKIKEPKNIQHVKKDAKTIYSSLSNNIFKSTCLERSLFSILILGMKGIHCTLQIGINNQLSEFQTHAWIECNNIVLIRDDRENIDNYDGFGNLKIT